jgi:hypothetical protein
VLQGLGKNILAHLDQLDAIGLSRVGVAKDDALSTLGVTKPLRGRHLRIIQTKRGIEKGAQMPGFQPLFPNPK